MLWEILMKNSSDEDGDGEEVHLSEWYAGTKLPTYKEERESKETGRKIKNAPQKYVPIWEQTGIFIK
jgi:hypothetical protein